LLAGHGSADQYFASDRAEVSVFTIGGGEFGFRFAGKFFDEMPQQRASNLQLCLFPDRKRQSCEEYGCV